MASERLIQVEVVFAPQARTVRRVCLSLAHGTTLGQALQRSALLSGLSVSDVEGMEAGVWGRKFALGHVLHDQDRVEIYRPLKVDPKVARRERFARQGAKRAGLFAKRRQGAKPGY